MKSKESKHPVDVYGSTCVSILRNLKKGELTKDEAKKQASAALQKLDAQMDAQLVSQK